MEYYLFFLILGFQVILTLTAIYVFYKIYNNIAITEKRLLQKEYRLKELYNLSTEIIVNYNKLYEKLISNLHEKLIQEESEEKTYAKMENSLQKSENPVKTPNTNNRRDLNKIVEMARKGYDLTQIAKASGMGKGEVKLILALHNKGK